MKKRSVPVSASASSRCSRHAATMLVLWARYRLRADGDRTKAPHGSTLADDGAPPRPPASPRASQPSRSRRSFTTRHQGLPGARAVSGRGNPRRTCQPMNARAALS